MFLITFIVSLFADVVPGLVAGVIASWFLSLTMPYAEVPVLRTLKQRISSVESKGSGADKGGGGAGDGGGSTSGSTHSGLVDGLLVTAEPGDITIDGMSDSEDYKTAVALLKFKLAIVFSNSTKIQVCVCVCV